MISIILPVRNGFKTISQTLDSIFSQSFKNFELILIDDGSRDKSASVYNTYEDHRLKLFKNEQMGLARTLNFGIRQATFDLISRIDQDDIMEVDYLSEHLNILQNLKSVVCVTNWARKINEANSVIGSIKPSENLDLQRVEIQFLNKYVHSAVSFRKSEVLKLGGYPTDPKLQPPEDYYLWSALFYNHYNPFHVIPKYLTRYRVTNGSMTQSDPEIAQRAKSIAYLNLCYSLKNLGVQDREWANYASSRIHVLNTKNDFRRLIQTILIVTRLFKTNNVKFTASTVLSLLELIGRIHSPNFIRKFATIIFRR